MSDQPISTVHGVPQIRQATHARAVAAVLDLRPLLAELELSRRAYRQAVAAFIQAAGEEPIFAPEAAAQIQLVAETTAEAVRAYREALARYDEGIKRNQANNASGKVVLCCSHSEGCVGTPKER